MTSQMLEIQGLRQLPQGPALRPSLKTRYMFFNLLVYQHAVSVDLL